MLLRFIVLLALVIPFSANAETSTNANKTLVVNFYKEVVLQKNIDAIDKYIGEKYIQHNPGVADGKEAFRELMKMLAANNDKETPPEEIVRVIAENDLVMLHVKSHSWPDKNGGAIVDIYRVENGFIVEHWDVVQSIPAESKNNNTMF